MDELNMAIEDLRSEVASGHDFESAAIDIAADYGISPVLLRRKFGERHVSVEAVRKRAKDFVAEARVVDYKKARALVEKECQRYRINPDNFFPLRGKKEIVIKTRLVDWNMVELVVDLVSCTVIERVRHNVLERFGETWKPTPKELLSDE